LDIAQIILSVCVILTIIAYIPLFMNKKLDKYQKMMWAMAIFFVAPVGIILYFIFGYKVKTIKPAMRKKFLKDFSQIEIGHPPHHPYNLK
jgi:uncharacterized membrane protein